MKQAAGVLIGGVLAGLLVLMLLPLLLLGGLDAMEDEGVCSVGGVVVAGEGLSEAQAANAEVILSVARELGVSTRGQEIAIAVALTESEMLMWANDGTSSRLTAEEAAVVVESLEYPHERVGHDWDSVNFFQQRPSTGWGSVADLMDPRYAARNFFGGESGPHANRGWPRGLLDVAGWEDMSQVDAAHEVQRSAFPERVGEHLELARAVVAGTSSGGACTSGGGVLGVGGYSHPVPGFHTFQGNYGEPREGGRYNHAGEDLSAPLGTAILAMSDGVVSHVSCAAWNGRSPCNVLIDHGQDEEGRLIQSLYVHMYPAGVLVEEGQQVYAGEQIAKVGSNGNSSGPHLHFEIWVGGSVVDPTPWMAGVGIDLRDPAAPPVAGVGSTRADEAIKFARSHVGDAYVLGANGPTSWDCSSLVQQAWASGGVRLPRTTGEQWAATTHISESELRPGDLVFYSRSDRASDIYHVALWVGGGQIVHASSPSVGVVERPVYGTPFGYARVG